MSQKKLHNTWGKAGILDNLIRNKSFAAGLALKLAFALLFASDYMTDLFVPFIKTAISGNFWNIYNVYDHIQPNAFPYPPVMLYILALPRYIASFIWSTAGPVGMVDVFCLKLPLIIADIAISVVLIKWLQSIKKVVKWYWLNPIIIYICYIHSQLDIIPTALFCVALYFLFKERYKWFALFIVLACTTKFHIVLSLPFVLIYLYKIKKLDRQSLTRGIPAILLAILLLNLPYLLQSGFLEMVYHNREQRKVFTSYFSLFENYRLFFIPASYMVMLYLMAEFKFVNKDILIIFLALGFGLFTFFLVPQPGWYLWNMPFFVYFLIRFNFGAKYMFVLLNVAYFVFFVVYPQSDIPQVAQLLAPGLKTAPNLFDMLIAYHFDAYTLVQLSFTLLQVSLLIFLISLFRLGVLQVKKYKIYNQPYLIGIGGDSGSGKSTLTKAVTDLFNGFALVVRGDDMHRWERGHEKWNEITHLNPKANWLHRDLADLIELKAGNRIKRRSYDHDTGKFTPMLNIEPNKIVIYEGLHSFYLKEASKIYDLKVFMQPSEELRTYWKIDRDVAKRGYAPEKVMEALQKRRSDSDAHILIQGSEADIIFSVEKSSLPESENVEGLQLKITCSNDIFFEHLLDDLTLKAPIKVHHEINRKGQEIIINGTISAKLVRDIAEHLHLDIKETIGSKPIWSENYLGVMQLVVAYSIFTQLKHTGVIADDDSFTI